MHRVEIRLTNEGNEPDVSFEVYNERLKDGTYVEMGPMREVMSGSAPIVMFLEADERVIVVAKGNAHRIVFDKEQNANVRIPTEAEVKDREKHEAFMANRAASGNLPPSPPKPPAPASGVTSRPVGSGTPTPAHTSPIDSKQVKKNG